MSFLKSQELFDSQNDKQELFDSQDVKNKFNNVYYLTVLTEPVYRSLTSNNNSIENSLSDMVFSNKLSTEDLACIFLLNKEFFKFDKDKVKNLLISNYYLVDEIFRQCDKTNNEVFKSKINNAQILSFNKSIEDRIINDLSYDKDFPISIETSSPYEFIVTGTKIWLIVKKGFITFLQCDETRMRFYRDFIKVVSSVTTFENYSHSCVYTHYVKELLN